MYPSLDHRFLLTLFNESKCADDEYLARKIYGKRTVSKLPVLSTSWITPRDHFTEKSLWWNANNARCPNLRFLTYLIAKLMSILL